MIYSLDDVIEFECGCKVSIDDFYDLIDKVKTENSDHTTGWHLTENHLELENTDRQDVGAALALISEQTAVCLEKYFPNHKPKLMLAKLIRCAAKSYKILTSRVRKDPKDHLKSAFGIYYNVKLH